MGSPWIRPRSLISKISNKLLFGWTLGNLPAKFEVRSFCLPVPEIIAIEVVGGCCEPQSWGRGARLQGVGDGTVGKSVGEFLYSLYSNFSSIFARFRDIAAFHHHHHHHLFAQ